MTSLLERVRDALAPHYAVERELGAGGMGVVGVVFLARDTRLDRMVAIKVLRPEKATAVAVERFQREARLQARLDHPNIVRVHAVAAADRTLRFGEAWDTHEWPQREAQSGEVDVAAGALARLRRAELAAATGRVNDACTLARRVRELWADAEPGYAALRRQAGTLVRECR
ncbi:MAG: protein kinase domain-containing protein [Gemmatimonadales bacterium]